MKNLQEPESKHETQDSSLSALLTLSALSALSAKKSLYCGNYLYYIVKSFLYFYDALDYAIKNNNL